MDIIDRFKNQRVSQTLHWKLPRKDGKPHRVCNCFRLKRERTNNVALLKRPDSDRAHYTGLQTCGSIWACPVCGSIISERRKIEFQRDIDLWRLKDPCNTILMITFTTPHSLFQPLGSVLKIQDDAIRIMKHQPQRKRYKVWETIMTELCSIGCFTGREVTFGMVNGWHPHRHEAHFSVRATIPELARAREEIVTAFAISFEKAGGVINDMKAFRRRSVRLDQITDDDGFDRISSYITKIEGNHWTLAAEATKGVVKDAKNGNITPYGMLRAIRSGDENSALYQRKFQEYALTMHGKRQFWPTKGLKQFLGTVHLTDQELMKENDDFANHYAYLKDEEWSFILDNELRGEILALTENRDTFQFLIDLELFLKECAYQETG